MRTMTAVVGLLLVVPGCLRPAEERALSDLEIGFGSAGSVSVETPSAHIVTADAGRLALWANHPVVYIRFDTPSAGPLSLAIDNCMPDAELVAESGSVDVTAVERPRATLCLFEVELQAGQTAVRVAPPDYNEATAFRFAVMGDIQTALPEVQDVFDKINEHPGIRYVVSTGDLVEHADVEEYEQLTGAFTRLSVPYFSTIGNHEIRNDTGRWSSRFGRFNIHFEFKDVAHSFLDTGSATIDPLVYEWLDGWLDEAEDGVHIYGQHFPAIDPVGVRQSAMRSRKEAAMLLSKLAAGGVDVTFYGHLHSYYAYQNAGMPAYISGGGGALPERWDGIGRHFLSVDVDPTSGIEQVAVVRVD